MTALRFQDRGKTSDKHGLNPFEGQHKASAIRIRLVTEPSLKQPNIHLYYKTRDVNSTAQLD